MLNRENTGLIVVDIQGKLARLVANSDDLINNCAALIKGARILGLPIVWLEQNPSKLGTTVTEISALLAHQTPLTKYTFGALSDPDIAVKIHQQGVKSWLICGIESHICVYQTASELIQNQFDVHLVVDCVSSRCVENKNLAIAKLSNSGAALTSLEMCLFELVKDCRAAEFKQVLTLIK